MWRVWLRCARRPQRVRGVATRCDGCGWLLLSCVKRPRRLNRSPVRRASEAVVTPVGGVTALREAYAARAHHGALCDGCGWLLQPRSAVAWSSRRSSGCFRRLHSNPRPVMDMSAPPPGGGHLPGTNFPEISNGSIGNFCKLLFLYIKNSMRASDLYHPTPLQPNAHDHIDRHA